MYPWHRLICPSCEDPCLLLSKTTYYLSCVFFVLICIELLFGNPILPLCDNIEIIVDTGYLAGSTTNYRSGCTNTHAQEDSKETKVFIIIHFRCTVKQRTEESMCYNKLHLMYYMNYLQFSRQYSTWLPIFLLFYMYILIFLICFIIYTTTIIHKFSMQKPKIEPKKL